MIKQKSNLPKFLAKRHLIINESTIENFIIKRCICDNRCTYSWKTCKFLGSLLDTDHDINRRKGLAIQTANSLEFIFKNKDVSLKMKLQVFNAYVTSIFLYNSEIWALTTNLEYKTNAFQKTLFRKYIFQVKWTEISSNTEICGKIKEKP